MATLEFRKACKDFGAVRVLHEIDLSIAHGEFTVFVGPSGCGKSTLLRMIAGLEDITEGTLDLDGAAVNDVEPGLRGVAMVFQNYALYPHMSARQNMAFGLENTGVARREIDRRVEEAARSLKIEQLLDRRPKAMSGGQRQRVAIGRAIVRDPKVFLFDEPLSNLDADLRVQTRIEIARLHKRLDATMIYVTHDQVEAMTLADRIVVLNAGRVEQVGSPLELYHNPRNRFVAGFIGSPRMNFFEGRVVAAAPDGVSVETSFGARIEARGLSTVPELGSAVTLGIRPEDLRRRADPSDAPSLGVEIEVVERLGGETIVHGQVGDGVMVRAKLDGQADIASGRRIELALAPGRMHVFDAGTGLALTRRHDAGGKAAWQ